MLNCPGLAMPLMYIPISMLNAKANIQLITDNLLQVQTIFCNSYQEIITQLLVKGELNNDNIQLVCTLSVIHDH